MPDLAVVVSDRSVTLASPIPGLGEMIAAIISGARKAIAASLILDGAGSFAGWICVPGNAISAIAKARQAKAAIRGSRGESERANRRAAAGVD